MEINELCDEAYSTAEEHGWHSPPRSFGDDMALLHSEISEALEEYRAGFSPALIYYEGDVPKGVPVELADLVIRVGDICRTRGIDLESAIELKLEFNKTRDFRHGGKLL